LPASTLAKRFGAAQARAPMMLRGQDIRRLQLHTLPDGFHRIRQYGFLANLHRAAKPELCRSLLAERHVESLPKLAQESSAVALVDV
jgi:hypothetical protein